MITLPKPRVVIDTILRHRGLDLHYTIKEVAKVDLLRMCPVTRYEWSALGNSGVVNTLDIAVEKARNWIKYGR